MKLSKRVISEAIVFLLIVLWVYSATSKVLDFEHFKTQMAAQTLPLWTSRELVYFLPTIEIITATLLFNNGTRLFGLILSFILMLVFTGYVGLVLLNVFGRIPCSCGGVIAALGWNVHFLFNLFFLLLTIWGIYIVYRERRIKGN